MVLVSEASEVSEASQSSLASQSKANQADQAPRSETRTNEAKQSWLTIGYVQLRVFVIADLDFCVRLFLLVLKLGEVKDLPIKF